VSPITITIEDVVPALPAAVRRVPGVLVATTRELLRRGLRQITAAPRPSTPAAPDGAVDAPESRVRLAVLIDADNAQATRIGHVLGEVATLGAATVARAYGDWASGRLTSWEATLGVHAVEPVQVFAPVKGKNATDCALIVDAMDLLYAGRLDGFCLVSSDSDFTRLATRLRRAGMDVYGFGQRKTPAPFVAACTRFVYVEDLADPATPATRAKAPVQRTAATRPAIAKAPAAALVPAQRPPTATLRGDTKLVTRLRAAVEAARDGDARPIGPRWQYG
jgi:hypothetical protein